MFHAIMTKLKAVLVLLLLPLTIHAQQPNKKLAAEVKAEFLHAWNGYKQHAWGHDDLKPLGLRFPAYSAPCIPFRWMRRMEAEEIAATEGIDYQPELEDQADEVTHHPHAA